MKIAIILSAFPNLSETFILNQITGLIDRGCQVEIFAKRKAKTKKVHAVVERYGLISLAHFSNVPHNPILFFFKGLFLMAANFFKSPTVTRRLIKMIIYKRTDKAFEALYFLSPFLGTNFDIIHCHFGLNGIIGLALKRSGIQGRLITTFHGFDLSSFLLKKGDNVYNELFKGGDLCLVVSKHWREKLIELNCDPKKIKIQRMGIDLEEFSYIERKEKPGKYIKLLTVGRLVEKKGHEYAIRALAKIVQKRENVEYTIAGDGPLKERLRSLVSELRMEKYIKFVGEVEKNEILALYRQAHIFLLPSATAQNGDQEGIPVVLMEALASGLPAVSSYHSGIPELIEDGKNGLLVPEKDTAALAEVLAYLIENPQVWPAMGRQGREFIEDHHDCKKLNQELLQIYNSLS
ncbi:MAG: glycosyltransferase [Candidatus Aminicenantes bacterium]|nr:glycosyltransferase [Candidatus Aminicenantes bacterium]